MAEIDRHHPSQRRVMWPPSPGFFRLRLAAKAWPVPAMITHQDGLWRATIDGAECSPHEDPSLAHRVSDIWEGGYIVPEQEYQWALAVKAAAQRAGDTDHPSLNPTRPINPLRLKPL